MALIIGLYSIVFMLDNNTASITTTSLLYKKIYSELEEKSKTALLTTRAAALSLIQDTRNESWKHYVLKNAAHDWLEKNIYSHFKKEDTAAPRKKTSRLSRWKYFCSTHLTFVKKY